jgi:AcrR family transcriptional regulator
MKVHRRTQADRTAATRTALVTAAQRLFAEHGFAGVGTPAIVSEAEVSRGALYHHFADKTALFEAVLDKVEQDIAQRLAESVLSTPTAGAVEAMELSVDTWLDLCEEPEVQRIALIDGPSVLGWARWREICSRHVLGLVEAMLVQGMEDGSLERQPVTPLAHVLLAVADEAAMYLASAEDPATTRQELRGIVRRLLASLTP